MALRDVLSALSLLFRPLDVHELGLGCPVFAEKSINLCVKDGRARAADDNYDGAVGLIVCQFDGPSGV